MMNPPRESHLASNRLIWQCELELQWLLPYCAGQSLGQQSKKLRKLSAIHVTHGCWIAYHEDTKLNEA
jgi:hypothetical protein